MLVFIAGVDYDIVDDLIEMSVELIFVVVVIVAVLIFLINSFATDIDEVTDWLIVWQPYVYQMCMSKKLIS